MIAPFPPSLQIYQIMEPVCKDDWAGFMPFMMTFKAPITLRVGDIVLVNAGTGNVEIVQRCEIKIYRYASRN